MRGTSAWVRGLGLTAALAVVLLPAGCGGGGKPNVYDRIDNADIPLLMQALEKFKRDCGRYPTKEEGLGVLLAKPGTNADKWAGPYVASQDALTDPWKDKYELALRTVEGRQVPRFWSAGPDRVPNTPDDYPQVTASKTPAGQRGTPPR